LPEFQTRFHRKTEFRSADLAASDCSCRLVGRLHRRLQTFGTGPMFITSCVGWVNGRGTNCKAPVAARTATLVGMLFMVIERFKGADPKPVGERFRQDGRMLPERVVYHASWIDPLAGRCFQIMKAPSLESLGEWTRRWDESSGLRSHPGPHVRRILGNDTG